MPNTINDHFPGPSGALAAPWAQAGETSGFNYNTDTAVPAVDADDCGMAYNGTGAPTWGADQYAQCAITTSGTSGGGSGLGPCVRHASAAKTEYRLIVDHASSNNCEIQKFVGGTFTSMGGAFTQAWTDGQTWKLQATGSSSVVLTAYLAGTQVFTHTDSSSPITTGAPGISSSGPTNTGSFVDDWTGSDNISTGGASVTAVPAQGNAPEPVPTIGAGSSVTAVHAQGNAPEPVPTISGSGGAGATVNAVVATATGDVVNPAVTAPDGRVAPPAAQATGAMPIAGLPISVEVDPGPESATGAVMPPTITGGTGGGIGAEEDPPPASATGDVVNPTLGAGASLTGVPAMATGTELRPVISPAGGGSTYISIGATFAQGF